MYALLLVVGAIVAAAGIALVGSGVSIEEHTFDPAIIAPGMVAIVGGLILVGLGIAVRALGRIERALALRPTAPTVYGNEVAVQTSSGELPAALAVPAPPNAATEPQPELPGLPPPPRLAEDAAVDRLRQQFPSLVRVENTPEVEDTDISLLPKPPVRADEDLAAATQKTNGAAPKSSVTRLEPAPRTTARRERPKSIDTFWPKRSRPGQPAVVAQPAAPAVAVEPAIVNEPQNGESPAAEPEAPAPAATMPVSILKSGVVDGMAYTLYSDGSIEAQLPKGRLRFGSIAELRTHIEQSA